ncbi:hypothetical protein PINS_up007684 [Pythium insidiosum]|nr:hypothetical protein PINS_up007684 [Pythium insidiosum]
MGMRPTAVVLWPRHALRHGAGASDGDAVIYGFRATATTFCVVAVSHEHHAPLGDATAIGYVRQCDNESRQQCGLTGDAPALVATVVDSNGVSELLVCVVEKDATLPCIVINYDPALCRLHTPITSLPQTSSLRRPLELLSAHYKSHLPSTPPIHLLSSAWSTATLALTFLPWTIIRWSSAIVRAIGHA